MASMPSARGRSSSKDGTTRKRKRTHTPQRHRTPKQSLTKAQRQKLRKRVKPLHSFARFDVFGRGRIWGMHLAGMPREDIVKLATKKDGSPPDVNGVDKVIATKKANPDWRGEESSAGGRPSALSDKQKKELVRLVFPMRGKVK